MKYYIAALLLTTIAAMADESVQYRVIETTNNTYQIEFKAERSPFWRTHTNTYATSNEAAALITELPTNIVTKTITPVIIRSKYQ